MGIRTKNIRTMKDITKCIIFITSLLVFKETVTENDIKFSTKQGEENKIKRWTQTVENICKKDPARKLHCHCDNEEIQTARTSNCLILVPGLTKSSPEWDSFVSQSKLEKVTFSVRKQNALTFIPPKTIVGLNKLKYVKIEFGNIKSIPPYAFTTSISLTTIDLESNEIYTLKRHAFSHMKSVINISLKDNRIFEIKPDVFVELPKLLHLDISTNNISILRDGCFKHLNNLEHLLLEDNYIMVITKESLEGLDRLLILNIKNNRISMIGNLAFSYVRRLKELHLDFNEIKLITERGFEGLTKLKMLNLSHNELQSFNEDILTSLKTLVVVDLRRNVMETFAYEYIQPMIEQAETAIVYLEDNPFTCDCRLAWVYKLRNDTNNYSLRHALSKITCVEQKPKILVSDRFDNYRKEMSYDYDDDVDYSVRKRCTLLSTIPVEDLPCTEEMRKKIYGLPVQKEIRVKDANSVGTSVPLYHLIIVLVSFMF